MRNPVILLLYFAAIAHADYAAGLRSYQAKDYVNAFSEWLPLAAQGDARSQNAIGSLFASGRGVTQDYSEAMRWYQKAADQGYAPAETAIGSLFLSGRGVTRDYAVAVVWFQKAADQGFVRAQNYMGYRYLRGEGVAQDYVKAETWFELSGPGTDQQDADARVEVRRHLTPTQIADASRAAQEWRANRATSGAAPPVRSAPPPTPSTLLIRPPEPPRAPQSLRPAEPITSTRQVTLTTAEIAKRVARSVVVIHGKTDAGDVLGSGFFVSKDGKIITNLHVIRDMKTANVQLSSGEMFDSPTVLATNELLDLAIIQVAGFDLPVLDLGDSDSVAVGEPLVIVGSPRGLEGSVTAGILSSVRDTGEGFTVLQTDAAVNPGNSGGPLLNNRGQAIGVVSFKLLSSEGLNFAIPVNYVRGLLSTLHGPVTLDQMRSGLTTTKPVQDDGGPTLRETLDWLKEKIPLGAVAWVQSDTNGATNGNVTRQSQAWSVSTCTIAVGSVDVVTMHFPPLPPSDFVVTERNTLPLRRRDQRARCQNGESATAVQIYQRGQNRL